MSLPPAWVDALFGKLALRYGAAFWRQYPDLDIQLVKDDWGHVLDGRSGGAIAYALANLPGDRPPNAIQFRNLCNAWQGVSNPLAIGHDAVPADPARVDRLMRGMADIQRHRDGMSPAEYCMQRIKAIVASRGGVMSAAQRHVFECCARVTGGESMDQVGGFVPIPSEQLPWNQPRDEA